MDLNGITSISQIHELLGLPPSGHPLITLLEVEQFNRPIPEMSAPLVTELYAVSLKNGSECSLKYGRKNYDFQQGSLMFLAPGQSILPLMETEKEETPGFQGWTLVFHPDLIRRTFLQNEISEYSFFNYHSSEALHLSEQERNTLTQLVAYIKDELQNNLDGHRKGLFVSQIALLLKYCNRFYGRQFITRSHSNLDTIARFEKLVRNYYHSPKASGNQLLSVKDCAKELGYSPNYLSDLIRKETGKGAQEHLYFYLIERAKDLLLSSGESIQWIADSLGFEYAQHFSKLFKNKVGISPSEYRQEN